MRSEAQKNRGVGKRSIDDQYSSMEKHALVVAADPGRAGRFRRNNDNLDDIGKSKGTNIQMIRLVYRRGITDASKGDEDSLTNEKDGQFSKGTNSEGGLPKEANSQSKSSVKGGMSSGSIVGIVLAVIFIIGLLGAVIMFKRRKPAEVVKRSASSVSVGGDEGTEI